MSYTELLVVVSIIGILFFLVLPPVSGALQTTRLYAQGESLLSDMRFLQRSSMGTRLIHEVCFLKKEYVLQRESLQGGREVIARRSLPAELTLSTNFKGGILWFTPSGNPSRPGSITLSTPKGKGRKIVISSIGRIRLSKATEGG